MYIMHSINIDTLPTRYSKVEIIEKYFDDNGISISFCYGSNFKNTRVIRRFVELISMKIWMSEEWVNRMILIVDELNNNAIEHGSESSSKSEMRVIMNKKDGNIQVNIEAQDSWTGPHPKTAHDMNALRKDTEQKWFKNHTSIRWRGLFLIITRLVDELYFQDVSHGGLIVWIHKNISL